MGNGDKAGQGPKVRRRREALAGTSDRETAVRVDFVPESDPAYPIIESILRVVPTSRWAFVRLKAGGELDGLLLESVGGGEELDHLKSEFTRQRSHVKSGPRVAATLGPLGDFESGITLLFADAHANFGILTLLRTRELGPFTTSEISILTLALDSTSERLSALRLTPAQRVGTPSGVSDRDDEDRRGSETGAFYVLDSNLQIVLTWSGEEQRPAAALSNVFEPGFEPKAFERRGV